VLFVIRGDHFRFGSVFIKTNNQTKIKKKQNRNRVKPTGFGLFFRAKTGSTRFGLVFLVLAWFFRFWLGFGSVSSVWLGFFLIFFGFGSVRFGSVLFFQFFAYKTKPNRPVFSKF
jgi:hypothetical protein